jgi:uncharacterized membrane protein
MFKRFLIAGLLIWLPLAVTLWVLDFIISATDRILLLLPASWRPEAVLGMSLPGLGLVVAAIILLGTGVFAANIIGERMVRWWESLMTRIPVVRSIYSGVKQVSDTLLSQKGQSFRKVVLIEFPQRGQWTLGFIVGEPGERLAPVLGATHVTVYVPTAPNPTSGYVIMVRPEEVREVDVSVDDAFKFHVSLGVVVPSSARATKVALPGHAGAPLP